LRADAKKEEAIRESQGRAEAILTIQRATAEGLRMIKEVQADEALIALKSLETMVSVCGRVVPLKSLFRRTFKVSPGWRYP